MFPKQMRYQTALRPDSPVPSIDGAGRSRQGHPADRTDRKRTAAKWDHGDGKSHGKSHEGSGFVRAPAKAAFGSPCNGCGFCCAAEPCGIAREFIGAQAGPCPAMEFDEGRFWCGLIRRPGYYLGGPAFADEIISPMIASALGAGQGCDSDDPRLPASIQEARA